MHALAPNLIPAFARLVRREVWVWNRRSFAAYSLRTMEEPTLSTPDVVGDNQLIMRVAQGDRAAFAALYDRFSTPLYSLALKMLADEAEAQDLLQEVFLSIWNKASTFRADRGAAFSWVVTQVRNRAIDRIRSRRRHGELIEANAPDLEPSGSFVESSADQCAVGERAREVRSALGQLNDEQRQGLRLAYFEGLTQTESAQKLAQPLGTIKARAHRGLARLRTLLRSTHD